MISDEQPTLFRWCCGKCDAVHDEVMSRREAVAAARSQLDAGAVWVRLEDVTATIEWELDAAERAERKRRPFRWLSVVLRPPQ